jgi:hypothetical protein
MVDERVNIYSDPLSTDLPTNTWTGDGRPQEKVSWIEKRRCQKFYVLALLGTSKKGVKAVPFPDGIIMEGGTKSLEELDCKGYKEGVLVTRLWYIRDVDPQSLLLTGLNTGWNVLH